MQCQKMGIWGEVCEVLLFCCPDTFLPADFPPRHRRDAGGSLHEHLLKRSASRAADLSAALYSLSSRVAKVPSSRAAMRPQLSTNVCKAPAAAGRPSSALNVSSQGTRNVRWLDDSVPGCSGNSSTVRPPFETRAWNGMCATSSRCATALTPRASNTRCSAAGVPQLSRKASCGLRASSARKGSGHDAGSLRDRCNSDSLTVQSRRWAS